MSSLRALGQCETDSDCDPGACCSLYGYCGRTPAYCQNESLRCTSDGQCPLDECCSKFGYRGKSDQHCASKTACERDADCGPGLCCSNANACVHGEYYCSDDDARSFDITTIATSSRPTDSPVSVVEPSGSLTRSSHPSNSPSTVADPADPSTSSLTITPTNPQLTSLEYSATSAPSAFPDMRFTFVPSALLTGDPTKPIEPAATSRLQPTFAPTQKPTMLSLTFALPSSPPTLLPIKIKVPITNALAGGGTYTKCGFLDESKMTINDVISVVPPDQVPVAIDFQYTINIGLNADLTAIIRALEGMMHDQLVSEKLDCSLFRRGRLVRRLRQNYPTAISTLKDDVPDSGSNCDNLPNGFECHVINGGVSVYFETIDAVAEEEVKIEYLKLVRESIRGGLFDGIDGVQSASFVEISADDVSSEKTRNGSGRVSGVEAARYGSDDDGNSFLSNGLILLIVLLCILAVYLMYVIIIQRKVRPKRKQDEESAKDNSLADHDSLDVRAEEESDEHAENELLSAGESLSLAELGNATFRGSEISSLHHSDVTLLHSNTAKSRAADLKKSNKHSRESRLSPSAFSLRELAEANDNICTSAVKYLMCSLDDHSILSEQPNDLMEFDPVFEDEERGDELAEENLSPIQLRQKGRRYLEVENTVFS